MKKDESGNYHIGFEGKEFLIFLRDLPSGKKGYYLRFEHRLKPYLRSLGTNVLASAKANALPKIKAIMKVDTATDDLLKLKSDFATIGEIVEAYLLGQGNKRTMDDNVNSLRNMIRVGLGVKNPDDCKSTVLTPELLEKFEKARMALVGTEYQRYAKSESRILTAHSVVTSTRSYVVHARALFSAKRMPLYKGLKLPDLVKFRGAHVASPKKRAPRALDSGVIEAINAAAPALAKSDPAAYVAHLMFKYLGMRNAEIRAAKWGWIEKHGPGDNSMAVIDRPEEGFKAKGNEGRVPVADDVLAELEKFKDHGTDGFIVPGATATDRRNAVDRRHSEWVSQWIKDRSKTSYELRRYAGSKVLDNGGSIEDVRDFLRHSDLKTTLDWYVYRLRKLKPLTMAHFAPAA
ncbi:MAG: site-specific integrase [bacterium]